MGYPTRLPFGISTVAAEKPLGSYPLPDPFHTSSTSGLSIVSYEEDFFNIPSSGWTITGASSTFPLADGLGGWAVVTPGAATTATAVYQAKSGFQFIAGNSFWYACRIKASAVSGTKAFYFGLRAGASANDGLWFAKAASSTSVNLVSTVASTATTLLTGVATAVADTWLDLAFNYNGTDLLVYSSGNIVGRVERPTVGASATTLTSALLAPVFQITPTATDTLTVDFVLAAQELTR